MVTLHADSSLDGLITYPIHEFEDRLDQEALNGTTKVYIHISRTHADQLPKRKIEAGPYYKVNCLMICVKGCVL